MFRSLSAQLGRIFHCFGIALLISFAVFFINFYAGLVLFLVLFAGMWRITKPLIYRQPEHLQRKYMMGDVDPPDRRFSSRD